MPADLPVLSVAGDQDPVGDCGAGASTSASNWLVDTGHEVATHLYTGYRHEIHNYDDLKFEVEEDLISWLMMHL